LPSRPHPAGGLGGDALDLRGNGAVVGNELGVGTVGNDAAALPHGEVLLAGEPGETPLLGDDDLLTSGELELATTEGLNDGGLVGILAADGEENLANVNTGHGSLGLTPGTTHTGLQPISTGAGKHFVDADDVEGVDTDAEVEGVLSGEFHNVLVGGNTGGLESLAGQLLVLVRDKVNAEGEVIDVGLLLAKVEDTNLGIGDTAVEAGLGVRLVLAVPVAASGTTTHDYEIEVIEMGEPIKFE